MYMVQAVLQGMHLQMLVPANACAAKPQCMAATGAAEREQIQSRLGSALQHRMFRAPRCVWWKRHRIWSRTGSGMRTAGPSCGRSR